MSLDNLFSPIKLGNLEVANRVVLAPMGVSVYSPDDAWPKKTIRYFEERAIGGTGLIISSFTRVHDKLATGPSPLIGIYDDRLIVSHAELVNKVHKHGSKIFLQTALHGCKFGGLEGPSAIYSLNYNVKPKELTTGELDYLVESFIKAAFRGKEAGYDGIEVHGGYSYLIGAMISPALNKRIDKYGGSFEGRMKFPTDIIKGILSKYPEYTVGFKYSAYEWLPGGVDIELAKEIAQYISKTGIAFLDIASSSSTTTLHTSAYSHVPPIYVKRNTLMPLAEAIKKVCPDMPVIANGAITVPEEAEHALANGQCDMVALGRGLIADPHWANKAKSGKSETITPCIRCNVCHHQLWLGTPLCCTMNPYVLHEAEQELSTPGRQKNVMIIGGGPSGMRCAITAAKRGHQVTLYEKKPYLGGMMYPGSRPEFKEDVRRALQWFESEIDKSNIKVKLNTEVMPETIEEQCPDVIVISVGAESIMPNVLGINHPKVISAIDLLSDVSKYKGDKAVVIGGGEVGCETACFLVDHGFEVTVVEMMSEILLENQITEVKLRLTDLMKEKNITILTDSQLNAVTDEGAEIIVPWDTQMGLSEGGRQLGLDADVIVIAINQKPNHDLIKMFTMKAEEFYIIGDCKSVGRIKEAVEEGERVGKCI